MLTAAPAFRYLCSAVAALFQMAAQLLTALHPTLLLRLPVGGMAVVAAEGVGARVRLRRPLRGLHLGDGLVMCRRTLGIALGIAGPFYRLWAIIVVSPVVIAPGDLVQLLACCLALAVTGGRMHRPGEVFTR